MLTAVLVGGASRAVEPKDLESLINPSARVRKGKDVFPGKERRKATAFGQREESTNH